MDIRGTDLDPLDRYLQPVIEAHQALLSVLDHLERANDDPKQKVLIGGFRQNIRALFQRYQACFERSSRRIMGNVEETGRTLDKLADLCPSKNDIDRIRPFLTHFGGTERDQLFFLHGRWATATRCKNERALADGGESRKPLPLPAQSQRFTWDSSLGPRRRRR